MIRIEPHPGMRVRHSFGWSGTLVTGNERQRDRRMLVDRDEGDRIWAMSELMEDEHVADFRVDRPDLAEKIAVGDLVRSYDFERHPDCWVEGEVVEITAPIEGCPRYRIAVATRAMEGRRRKGRRGEQVLPPVNGAATLSGGYTNGVRKVVRDDVPVDAARPAS